MSRAYDHYIHTLLNPDDVLITGNQKKHKPAWKEKQELIDKMREELGQDEMNKMEEEFNKRYNHE